VDQGIADPRRTPRVALLEPVAEDGDGDAGVAPDRRGPSAAQVGLVAPDAEDASGLGGRGRGGIDGGVVRRGNGVPAVVEIGIGDATSLPGDLTRLRERLQRRRDLG